MAAYYLNVKATFSTDVSAFQWWFMSLNASPVICQHLLKTQFVEIVVLIVTMRSWEQGSLRSLVCRELESLLEILSQVSCHTFTIKVYSILHWNTEKIVRWCVSRKWASQRIYQSSPELFSYSFWNMKRTFNWLTVLIEAESYTLQTDESLQGFADFL